MAAPSHSVRDVESDSRGIDAADLLHAGSSWRNWLGGASDPHPRGRGRQCEADDARLKRSFAAPRYTLAFGAGLRMGELLALRWGPDGLDLDSGVVHVRAS